MFRGHALLVTVNENRDHLISSLGNTVLDDGNAVEQTLLDEDVCGYAINHVKRLSGVDASHDRITSAIEAFASSIREDDPFLMYFSGHGGLHSDGTFLVPYDADIRTGADLLYSDELSNSLGRLPSKRKLIIIDACHSGGLNLSGSVAKGPKYISNAVLNAMAEGEGVVVITSSRSNEVSYIQAGDPLSLFTKHLVSGLRGAGGHDKSGFVRVFDLFNYVAENVRKEESRQAPVYAAHHQDINFPIAFCGAAEKRIQVPRPVLNDGAGNLSDLLLQTLCDLYPLGPSDQEIWQRAGGDLSRLDLAGSGRTVWLRAVRDIERGGSPSARKIIAAAYEDYPLNNKLQNLLSIVDK